MKVPETGLCSFDADADTFALSSLFFLCEYFSLTVERQEAQENLKFYITSS